jgi:hypothetical protein
MRRGQDSHEDLQPTRFLHFLQLDSSAAWPQETQCRSVPILKIHGRILGTLQNKAYRYREGKKILHTQRESWPHYGKLGFRRIEEANLHRSRICTT